MIDFALDRAGTARYKHAARHLAEAKRLSAGIRDRSPIILMKTTSRTLDPSTGAGRGFGSLPFEPTFREHNPSSPKDKRPLALMMTLWKRVRRLASCGTSTGCPDPGRDG
ncbi:DUF6880 family protein [Phyllobacterium zundukense]|uniref:DUF6880 family protein n=1 Tax=Phyllobacterium zundukense TaxID=1867719 RepID=UPI003965B6C2